MLIKIKVKNAKILVANRQKFISNLHLRGFYQTRASAKYNGKVRAIVCETNLNAPFVLFFGILHIFKVNCPLFSRNKMV